MRFSVEQWQPEYGAAFEMPDDDPAKKIDLEIERKVADWGPVPANPEFTVDNLVFIDGVRRIDAQVWLPEGLFTRRGMCASIAAGVVRCNGSACVEVAEAKHVLIAPRVEGAIQTRQATYEHRNVRDDQENTLKNGLAKELSSLEELVASRAAPADLVVVDGPLRGREKIPHAVGYIKSHRVGYLPPELAVVVALLAPTERTPVFFLETSWTRYTWYLRLPNGKGHPWAGVVRCEAPPSLSVLEVVALASKTAATLPSYASEPHKDGRSPQNLYPIGGLESYLRGRLGSAELLYRLILEAAGTE